MNIVNLARKISIGFIVVLPILLIVGCVASDKSLTARLTAANLLAGSAAQGLVTATRAQAIKPGSEAAVAIVQTLDAVERSLDSAGSALRAGLPDMAARNLDAAETQLIALQPLLPSAAGGQ